MPYVQLGNASAIEGFRLPDSDDPEKVHYREAPGDRITTMSFPAAWSVEEIFEAVLVALPLHIVPGEKPVWIESDDKALELRLQEHLGVSTRKGRTKKWGQDTGAVHVVSPGPVAFTLLTMLEAVAILGILRLDLRTDAGRDLVARVMGDPASSGAGQYAPACWMGLSANSDPPAGGNTTLPGEITTGTLARAQGSYGHTNGTNSYTVTKVYTSDQSVTIAKGGLYNASTAGTLAWETMLNSPAILNSADQLQNTQTVTMA